MKKVLSMIFCLTFLSSSFMCYMANVESNAIISKSEENAKELAKNKENVVNGEKSITDVISDLEIKFSELADTYSDYTNKYMEFVSKNMPEYSPYDNKFATDAVTFIDKLTADFKKLTVMYVELRDKLLNEKDESATMFYETKLGEFNNLAAKLNKIIINSNNTLADYTKKMQEIQSNPFRRGLSLFLKSESKLCDISLLTSSWKKWWTFIIWYLFMPSGILY